MITWCKFCPSNPDEAIGTYGGLPICADCQAEVDELDLHDWLAEKLYDRANDPDMRESYIDSVREGKI